MSWVRRLLSSLVLTLGLTVAVSAPAGALTLGNTAGTPNQCFNATGIYSDEYIQTGTAPGDTYTVPAGGGEITSWSFNATGAGPGYTYGLVVVSPNGYTVVGSDTESVGNSPSGIETFSLATPIIVQAGDLIGDFLPARSDAPCSFGGQPAADTLRSVEGSTTVGSVPYLVNGNVPSARANIAVNLVQSEDASITQTSARTSVAAGGTDAFLLSVANTPAPSPVSVTDSVPSGLSVDSVVPSSGSCTTSGQSITCTGVTAPATIAVIVTASQAGSFTNNASVGTPFADSNSANNSSSATLQVAGAVSAALEVSPASEVAQVRWASLARLPLSDARTVIRDLGLKVGKITHKSSKSIHKGDVISTSAQVGQQIPIGTTITIVASSGKPRPKRR
jgi:hypothetical protein